MLVYSASFVNDSSFRHENPQAQYVHVVYAAKAALQWVGGAVDFFRPTGGRRSRTPAGACPQPRRRRSPASGPWNKCLACGRGLDIFVIFHFRHERRKHSSAFVTKIFRSAVYNFRTKILRQKNLAPADWFTVHGSHVSFGNDSHIHAVISKRKSFHHIEETIQRSRNLFSRLYGVWYSLHARVSVVSNSGQPEHAAGVKKWRGHIEATARRHLDEKVIPNFFGISKRVSFQNSISKWQSSRRESYRKDSRKA